MSSNKSNTKPNSLRYASTKTEEEGSYYCAISHKNGFMLGMILMAFLHSIGDHIDALFPETAAALEQLSSVVPWLLGVWFILTLISSYPYFMDGKQHGGELYDELKPEPKKPEVKIYTGL